MKDWPAGFEYPDRHIFQADGVEGTFEIWVEGGVLCALDTLKCPIGSKVMSLALDWSAETVTWIRMVAGC
jgi:hypothetical protein